MDIQKEEDDFNAWFNKQTINAVPDADLSLQRLWASLAWQAQAAKAQAVPEGFVLVSRDTLNKALNPNDYDEAVCSANELLAVIEAQEPSSTSDYPDEP